MRYVPRTKKDRLALVEAQIQDKIGRGYTLETYKGLRILIKDEDERNFMLVIYKDAAVHPIANYYCRTADRRTIQIENAKSLYDRNAEYKAKQKTNPTISTAANAAKAIRAELAEAFKGIKFSVTSSTFSMGNSVSVGWNDGPTSREVEEVTNKYQQGHFDGMTDMYEYSNSRDDIPQAKYISASRHMSPETRAILEPIAEKLFEGYQDSNSLWRVFQASPLPADAKVTGIDSTTDTCGPVEHLYRITYEAPEAPQTKSAEPQIERQEISPGTIQIIEYGRGIAVIGDTKPIKDLLKSLGGRFNFRLTCGAGWVFRRTDLERVTEALKKQDGKQGLRDEIQKTVEFFADTDRKLIGAVSESTQEIARVQNVKLPDDVRHFDNIEDMEQAVNNGEVISLANLSELVNKPKAEQVNAWGLTASQARGQAQQRRMDKAMRKHGAARRRGDNTATYY